MIWCERGSNGEALVHVLGSLDSADGMRLRELIDTESTGRVTVDLKDAEENDYCGLAVLMKEARCDDRKIVRLCGLVEGQIRFLRNFGLEPAQFGIDRRGETTAAL